MTEDQRKRMNFYEQAMKEANNHGALALEMAYLRSVADKAERAKCTRRQLVAEFYDGTAEKDWAAWGAEAVAILEAA